MVHEAMVLEYSGRHLALIEAASHLKLVLYLSLLICLFAPFGMAPASAGLSGWAIGLAAWTAKLLAGAVLLGVWEVSIAKMRVFRLPDFVGIAFVFGFHRHPAGLPLGRRYSREAGLRNLPPAGGCHAGGKLRAPLPAARLRRAQCLRRPVDHAGAGGRLGRLVGKPAGPVHHRGDRLLPQGHRHSGGTAPHGGAARHSSRGREGGGRGRSPDGRARADWLVAGPRGQGRARNGEPSPARNWRWRLPSSCWAS